MTTAKNDAERHFEAYLTDRGITWDYEKPAGDKHPDYWLHVPSEAVCEIRHVTAALDGPGGAFDAYAPLAKAVKRKAPQGKALDGVQPYVVVLWAPGWPTDHMAVSGALFGRVQVTMPFNPETGTADSDQARVEFGRNAELRADQHRHVSAVAVIRRFNPGLRAAEDEVQDRLTELRVPPGDQRIADVIFEVYGRRRDEGLLDDDARTVRIETFHNMHASTPLSLAVFSGPYDVQHQVAEGIYTTVWEGDQVDRLPD